MTNLPIENHPELLQEYGRALACIGAVDLMLIGYITTKDASKTFRQLEEDFTLGQKVGLARDKKWLGPVLITKLLDLNEDRKTLAHGVTGEIVENNNANNKSGKFVISHKGQKNFDLTFLQAISTKAKKLTVDMYNAMPIPAQYKRTIS